MSSEILSAHYFPGLRFSWLQTLKVPTYKPLFKFPWLSNFSYFLILEDLHIFQLVPNLSNKTIKQLEWIINLIAFFCFHFTSGGNMVWFFSFILFSPNNFSFCFLVKGSNILILGRFIFSTFWLAFFCFARIFQVRVLNKV